VVVADRIRMLIVKPVAAREVVDRILGRELWLFLEVWGCLAVMRREAML